MVVYSRDFASFVSVMDRLRKGWDGGIAVMVSGGFDIIHPGHTRNLREAALLGDRLIVVVNSDRWLVRKKGAFFLPVEQRLELVDAVKGVDFVVEFDDGGDSVAGAILALKPQIFAKGGDRSSPENMRAEEVEACERVGCEVVYGVGGSEKINSSSSIARRAFIELSRTHAG